MADDHKEHAEHGSEGGHGGGGHGGGHGGGAHAGGAHEEHEGAPEWLISFADNVALMMGFFVILLAMNMQKPSMGGVGGEGKYPSDVPSKEMEDFAIAMRAAFNRPVDPNSTDPHEAALVRRLRERATEGGKAQTNGVDGRDTRVTATRPNEWVHPVALAYFNDFETTLNDEGRHSLAQITDQLMGQRWMIEIRGHASASETNGNKARGMQLGSARAAAVAEELVKNGLQWEQLRVVGCADNERATPRPTNAEGHRSNQRVEIVVTQEEMPGDPYNQPAGRGDSNKLE